MRNTECGLLREMRDVCQQAACDGKPMYVLWRKLQLIKPAIKHMQRQYSNIPDKLQMAREKLEEIHQ